MIASNYRVGTHCCEKNPDSRLRKLIKEVFTENKKTSFLALSILSARYILICNLTSVNYIICIKYHNKYGRNGIDMFVIE